MRKRGFRTSRGESCRWGQHPGSLDPRQPAAPGTGLALSYAAFRVPEQQGATSLPGAAKPLSLYLCSHRHLHRNAGMERPRAPYFTANGRRKNGQGYMASASSLPYPWAPLFAEEAPRAPRQAPKQHAAYTWPPCPSPCRVGLSSHSSEEQNETRGTDQDTCVLLKPLGTSLQ